MDCTWQKSIVIVQPQVVIKISFHRFFKRQPHTAAPKKVVILEQEFDSGEAISNGFDGAVRTTTIDQVNLGIDFLPEHLIEKSSQAGQGFLPAVMTG